MSPASSSTRRRPKSAPQAALGYTPTLRIEARADQLCHRRQGRRARADRHRVGLLSPAGDHARGHARRLRGRPPGHRARRRLPRRRRLDHGVHRRHRRRASLARHAPHPHPRREVPVSCCAPGAELDATALAPPSDDELLLASRALGNGRRQVELALPAVHCAACIQTVEHALCDLPGVEAARVNLSTRRVSVKWREGDLPPITATLTRLGYAPNLFDEAIAGRDGTMSELLRAVAVSGFAAGNIMLLSVSVWSGAEGRHARPVPLGLGADRAAGAVLRRPHLLPLRLERAAPRPHEHGRADRASASRSPMR